jgi:hypothetical protein
MKEFMTNLKAAWDIELQIVQANEEDKVKICKTAVCLTGKTLAQLRKHLLKTKFKNTEEEIWFFKEAKPEILSKLIYYDKLYHIEVRRPMGREKIIRKYLETELMYLEHSSLTYTEFYLYLRSGQTLHDELYFTRNKQNTDNDCIAKRFDLDPNLSTGYDVKVAKIMANEQLISYLDKEIHKLRGDNLKHPNISSKIHVLEWTGPKTGMVELIYGLAQAGTFNHGKADHKDIAGYFEQVFNVSLGNFYKTFEKIRMRDCGPTTFLDSVKLKLLDYTDKFNELRIN